MEKDSKPGREGGSLRTMLCPAEPRQLPWGRPVQVGLRTLHLIAMGVVLGGVARGGTHETLLNWIVATIVSGVLLLGIDVWKSALFLVQGAGVAVLLKLLLLGLGNLFPGARFEWYLAATALASIGSHMVSSWRHFSFVEWRVVGTPGKH
jgi:hypothetical protein